MNYGKLQIKPIVFIKIFSGDDDIAFNYDFFLRELAKKQEVLNELEETVTKAEEVYECFHISSI